MLIENQVVDYVCYHLRKIGFSVIQSAHVGTKGVDIIAQKDDWKVHIEAKGETSAVETSNRYGKAFTPSQVFDVLSKVIFKSLSNKNKDSWDNNDVCAIAIPDVPLFREWHNKVEESLHQLQLVTIWVDPDGKVSVDADKYTYLTAWYYPHGSFHAPSYLKVNTAVNDYVERDKQGFEFYVNPFNFFAEDHIPVLHKDVIVKYKDDYNAKFNLDYTFLNAALDSMRLLRKIQALSG